MNCADYIFERLKQFGVRHVFMLSGGGCMYLTDALGLCGIPFTCCLHEQAAAIAALAHAQYTGELGVVLVTSGPGGTNAVTGVMAAWTESVPLLVLSGQVKRSDIGWLHGIRTKGVQEAPITDVVRPITKYAATIQEPRETRLHLERAIHTALEGRKGPVWLDLPLDIQSAELDFESLAGYAVPKGGDRKISPAQAGKLQALLSRAKGPVILAGYGLRASAAVDSFENCANSMGIPVLTTWKAIDVLPEDHPLYIGRPGVAGQRAANIAIQNADLLICIGARLDSPQIGYEQYLFAREAKKVIVDVDPAELTKWSFEVDLPICADAKEFIETLSGCVAPEYSNWLQNCVDLKNRYGLVPEEHYKNADYASLYLLVDEISRQLTSDDVIVPGSSGMGSDVSYQVTKIKRGQRMLNSPGLGAMGFGVPSALGACIASGGRRTVCVNGDGGFQMNIQDLETIASLKLPIKFFVINNRGYGSIRNTQRNYFNGRYVGSGEDSGVSLPDIKKIGAAYGFDVFQIAGNAGIHKGVKAVLASPRPAVCEVLVDPNDTLQFRASSVLLPDGSSKTAPIEDLFPQLPRKELYAHMLVRPVNALGINLCNIIFDLDGTLADSSQGITESVKYALDRLGYPQAEPDAIRGTIGLSLIRMFERLMPGLTKEQYEELGKAYREHYAETGVLRCGLYPGIKELIEEVSKEFDLYIVTSKPTVFAKKILRKFDIAGRFKSVKGTGLEFAAKTKAELLRDLMQEGNLDPQKSIMIGDRAEDINAANPNGIKAIAVTYGYGLRDELSQSLKIVDSVEELRSMLY
jgi:acetolactate synthase-1/2/3 large subunit